MIIQTDDLRGPEIATLLETHQQLMLSQSPPESCHVLDLNALRADHITFWSAWDDGMLLGCAALSDMGDSLGEIKSMHTSQQARGRGIGAKLLQHLEKEARQRGYKQLYLETGKPEGFAAARRLYEKFGYRPCPPFGSYVEDPFSVFMTKKLA